MIITKEQAVRRVNSEQNIVGPNFKSPVPLSISDVEFEVLYRDGKNHVGRPDSKNLTEDEKIAIGVLANTVGNETAATLMGVSENTARHLRSAQTTESQGQGTQKYGVDENLKDKIAERLDKTKLSIQERAAEKLLASMNLLDDEKLENSSAKELSQIATQMSQVVRNMETKREEGSKGSNVKIVIHQPREIREDSFEVIEISSR